jgi:hypothetical protein
MAGEEGALASGAGGRREGDSRDASDSRRETEVEVERRFAVPPCTRAPRPKMLTGGEFGQPLPSSHPRLILVSSSSRSLLPSLGVWAAPARSPRTNTSARANRDRRGGVVEGRRGGTIESEKSNQRNEIGEIIIVGAPGVGRRRYNGREEPRTTKLHLTSISFEFRLGSSPCARRCVVESARWRRWRRVDRSIRKACALGVSWCTAPSSGIVCERGAPAPG